MRRAVLAAALGGLAIACGGNRATEAPIAMTIKPVGSTNTVPAAPPIASSAEPEMPVQVVIALGRLCVRTDGKIYCQPYNSVEQPLVQEKLRLPGIDDAVDVSANGHGFMCATTRRGTAMCMGTNDFGELGARTDKERIDSFVEVAGLGHVRRVVTGPSHACAILDDKSVWCWGRNDHGQTGSDTTYKPQARELVTPTKVPGVEADEIALDSSSTCARTPKREVVCWGVKQQEQYTGGKYGNERPTRLGELDEIDEIRGKESGFCALRAGKVLCWSGARRMIPGTDYFGNGVVSAPGIKDAQQLALGDGHGCILHSDGRVSCFGYPYTGALGHPPPDPNKVYDAAPAAIVEGAPRAKAIAAGMSLSCVLTREDDLWCWGRWYTSEGTHDEPAPVRIRLH